MTLRKVAGTVIGHCATSCCHEVFYPVTIEVQACRADLNQHQLPVYDEVLRVCRCRLLCMMVELGTWDLRKERGPAQPAEGTWMRWLYYYYLLGTRGPDSLTRLA